MDASTIGSKGSISKLEKGRGVRKARVLQGLFMQAALALMLLTFAIVARNEPRNMGVFLAFLLVPAGWGYIFWSAHQKEEAARSAGLWTKEWDAALKKRTFRWLGGCVAAALLLAVASYTLL